jgi:HSP20 family molecular chaperone IbpA
MRSNWFGSDVTGADTGYEVEVPVPGFKPEEVEVT